MCHCRYSLYHNNRIINKPELHYLHASGDLQAIHESINIELAERICRSYPATYQRPTTPVAPQAFVAVSPMSVWLVFEVRISLVMAVT